MVGTWRNNTMVKLSEYFKQEGQNLYAKELCSISLSKDQYELDDNYTIYENEKILSVKGLVAKCNIVDGDITFDIILDYSINLNIIELEDKKDEIVLTYHKDSMIFTVPAEHHDVRTKVLYIRRLLGGSEIFKDSTHLVMKLANMYSKFDLIHLELLISQSLRDKDKPILPARVGKDPDNPKMSNIKKDIFYSGFIQGLAFENINEAIRTGLTAEHHLEPTILEKVFLGEIVKKPEK